MRGPHHWSRGARTWTHIATPTAGTGGVEAGGERTKREWAPGGSEGRAQVSGSKLGELRMERGEGQGPRAPDMLPNLRAPLDPSADRMREGMRNSLAPEGNRGTSLTGLPPEGVGWRVNGWGSGEGGNRRGSVCGHERTATIEGQTSMGAGRTSQKGNVHGMCRPAKKKPRCI
jgi:hypothetical protein